MLPMQNHPLTLAMIAGARATTHDAVRHSMMIARQLARELTQTQVEQCKLAAEVLIERKIA